MLFVHFRQHQDRFDLDVDQRQQQDEVQRRELADDLCFHKSPVNEEHTEHDGTDARADQRVRTRAALRPMDKISKVVGLLQQRIADQPADGLDGNENGKDHKQDDRIQFNVQQVMRNTGSDADNGDAQNRHDRQNHPDGRRVFDGNPIFQDGTETKHQIQRQQDQAQHREKDCAHQTDHVDCRVAAHRAGRGKSDGDHDESETGKQLRKTVIAVEVKATVLHDARGVGKEQFERVGRNRDETDQRERKNVFDNTPQTRNEDDGDHEDDVHRHRVSQRNRHQRHFVVGLLQRFIRGSFLETVERHLVQEKRSEVLKAEIQHRDQHKPGHDSQGLGRPDQCGVYVIISRNRRIRVFDEEHQIHEHGNDQTAVPQ